MNKLKLSDTKPKQLKINNEMIEKFNRIKYLGFIIDKDFKLNQHIDYICKKIGFLKRISNKISIMTVINIIQ